MSTRAQRRSWSSYGAHKSWAQTPDRSARTRKARANGPSDLPWHVARLDPERFANATEAQKLAAAEAARKAYFAELGLKSAAARRGSA